MQKGEVQRGPIKLLISLGLCGNYIGVKLFCFSPARLALGSLQSRRDLGQGSLEKRYPHYVVANCARVVWGNGSPINGEVVPPE